MKRPIKNCYWVIEGKLLAGEYPRNRDEESLPAKLKALLDSGIEVFIDLTEEDEGLLPYAGFLKAAVHKRFAVPDVSVPEHGLVEAVLDTIDQHIRLGQKVYVHCWGGVGRTGVVIGCWIARRGSSGEDALEGLRELWRHCPKSARRRTPETPAQEAFIRSWPAGR